jgi:coenzyme PQQ synthesis protein D (PqqD)
MRLARGVHTTRNENGTVDLEIVKGQKISLNETGAVIWRELELGLERPEILNELCKNFNVERGVAEKDLDDFLSQLEDNLLISSERGS